MNFGPEGKQNCAWKGCPAEAVWYPVVRVFARGFRNSAPMQTLVSLALCESCTTKIGVEDVVTDQFWKTICQVLEAAGRAAPDRDRTQLTYWPIKDAQAGVLPSSS